MRARKAAVAIAVVMWCAPAPSAVAGLSFQFSSDTGAGTGTVFRWDGGDAGGFGTAGTLHAAMRYAASESAGTNFAGTSFASTGVNIYLVDFRRNERYMDAGLTMFVMWGNGSNVDDFAATVSASPVVERGTDGSYTAGVPEVFALGAGVNIREIGPLTVDIDVEHSETPIGFAVSNLQALPGLRFNQQFTLVRAIAAMGIYGMGEQQVWAGVDDDENDNIFTDGVVIIVPAPPAAMALLIGLAGFRSRRRE